MNYYLGTILTLQVGNWGRGGRGGGNDHELRSWYHTLQVGSWLGVGGGDGKGS